MVDETLASRRQHLVAVSVVAADAQTLPQSARGIW